MLGDVALLSHRTGLDRKNLMGILNRGTPQTVMVLLRGLYLKWPAVAAVMALRAMKQRTRQTIGSNAQRDYEAIDSTAAKRTLRFLQIRNKAAPDDAGD